MSKMYDKVNGKKKLVRCACTDGECAWVLNGSHSDQAAWKYDYFQPPSKYDRRCPECGYFFFFKK